MPNISGIELFKSLKNPPSFIFITSHLEHAVESFELDALDFIPKPISYSRLVKSVNKAVEYLAIKGLSKDLSSQIEYNHDFFFIKDSKGHVRINNNEILYIESFGDFCKINLCNKQQHLVLVNLKNIEQQLPSANFLRIHRQFIINQNLITEIIGNEVILNKQHRITIGAAYRNKLMEHIDKITLARNTK